MHLRFSVKKKKGKQANIFFSRPAAEILSCISGKLGQSDLLTM